MFTMLLSKLIFPLNYLLGIVNAIFSKFSVIATHSSMHISFGSVNLVLIFFYLFLVTLFTETRWIRSDSSQNSGCQKQMEKAEAWMSGKYK